MSDDADQLLNMIGLFDEDDIGGDGGGGSYDPIPPPSELQYSNTNSVPNLFGSSHNEDTHRYSALSSVWKEPVSGFVLKRKSDNSLEELIESMKYYSLSDMSSSSHLLRQEGSSEWMAIGVVTSKSQLERSKKGNSFVKISLSDLDKTECLLMLFDQAFEQHYRRIDVGTVIVVVSPNILDEQPGGSFNRIALTVSSPGSILILGNSAEISHCKGTTKSGISCTMHVNLTKHGGYCKYHLSQATRVADSNIRKAKGITAPPKRPPMTVLSTPIPTNSLCSFATKRPAAAPAYSNSSVAKPHIQQTTSLQVMVPGSFRMPPSFPGITSPLPELRKFELEYEMWRGKYSEALAEQRRQQKIKKSNSTNKLPSNPSSQITSSVKKSPNQMMNQKTASNRFSAPQIQTAVSRTTVNDMPAGREVPNLAAALANGRQRAPISSVELAAKQKSISSKSRYSTPQGDGSQIASVQSSKSQPTVSSQKSVCTSQIPSASNSKNTSRLVGTVSSSQIPSSQSSKGLSQSPQRPVGMPSYSEQMEALRAGKKPTIPSEKQKRKAETPPPDQPEKRLQLSAELQAAVHVDRTERTKSILESISEKEEIIEEMSAVKETLVTAFKCLKCNIYHQAKENCCSKSNPPHPLTRCTDVPKRFWQCNSCRCRMHVISPARMRPQTPCKCSAMSWSQVGMSRESHQSALSKMTATGDDKFIRNPYG